METWSLKEYDSKAIDQRYSEVEDDYNFQSMMPLRVCVWVLCQGSTRLHAA